MEAFNEAAAFLGVSSPYLAIFVLLTVGIWLFPLAEELALITAGYLIYRGTVQWWLMVPVAGLGVLLGDAVLFYLGRRCGISALPQFVVVPRSGRWTARLFSILDRYGGWALLCARFLPGVRFPIHMVVGASGMSVMTYLQISLLSVIAYVPLIVMFASTFGDEIEEAMQKVHGFGYAAWVVVLIAVVLCFVLQHKGAPRAGTSQ